MVKQEVNGDVPSLFAKNKKLRNVPIYADNKEVRGRIIGYPMGSVPAFA